VSRRAGLVRDLVVLGGLAVYAMPFFWQILTSLKPEAELMVLPPLLPSRLTLEHYKVVLEQSVMLRAMVNSLGVGVLTTVFALALGVAAAYGLARYHVPGKGLVLLVVVAGTAFPQIATVSPLYLMMRGLGLRDTWLALVLANTSFALPLVIWLLVGFIREIPVELEQAAAVDGA
jgi:trehalose/maltose transport system permease protein